MPPPAALAAAQPKLASSDVVADIPAGSGFGRWLLVLAAAIIVVGVVGYRVLHTRAESAQPAVPPAAALAAPPGEKSEPALAAATPAPETTPSAVEAAPAPPPSATAEPTARAAEPAAPAPSGAPAAPSAEAVSAEVVTGDVRSVTLNSVPPKARFYHFGKAVGTAPFVLQLKPGERHAYEVGLPGYTTRKVVIDGSKPEITVGLRKETH